VANESQLWNVQTTGTMSTIAALAGDKGCWEVNGCNYVDGASVDTDFGCKPLPSPGLEDPCCSNMAWHFNASGAITSIFSEKCFEVAAEGGGSLATCNGSQAQRWRLRGIPGRQQIVAETGAGCISRAERPEVNAAEQDLVYDVKASLGWETAAVRDLWTHKDLGVMTKIAVRLAGDGDSRLLKLTIPSVATFI